MPTRRPVAQLLKAHRLARLAAQVGTADFVLCTGETEEDVRRAYPGKTVWRWTDAAGWVTIPEPKPVVSAGAADRIAEVRAKVFGPKG